MFRHCFASVDLEGMNNMLGMCSILEIQGSAHPARNTEIVSPLCDMFSRHLPETEYTDRKFISTPVTTGKSFWALVIKALRNLTRQKSVDCTALKVSGRASTDVGQQHRRPYLPWSWVWFLVCGGGLSEWNVGNVIDIPLALHTMLGKLCVWVSWARIRGGHKGLNIWKCLISQRVSHKMICYISSLHQHEMLAEALWF